MARLDHAEQQHADAEQGDCEDDVFRGCARAARGRGCTGFGAIGLALCVGFGGGRELIIDDEAPRKRAFAHIGEQFVGMLRG